MIPKIIHYCWFGKSDKPQSVLDCIATWRKEMPDYEIKEWNEYNFDCRLCDFSMEAYLLKKYAFVSDVARLYALYTEGGIYMDTDVRVVHSFDKYLGYKSFIGRESPCILSTAVIGAEAGTQWVKDFLQSYTVKGKHFILNDGSLAITPNSMLLSSFITWTWDCRKNELTIFNEDYFCCTSYASKKQIITENSVAIHCFKGSWCAVKKTSLKDRLTNLLLKIRLRYLL